MLCNKLTHTHPLGCISPDKRSGVTTTKPSLLAQRPGRCHRDQGPCACPSLGSGREVSLQPTRVPQVFRVGRTPTPSLAVACCCTHTWEEVPEAAPCQPARISSSVEVPVKRCLLSLKSMVLSALLQLIYSWETPNDSLKNSETIATAKKVIFFFFSLRKSFTSKTQAAKIRTRGQNKSNYSAYSNNFSEMKKCQWKETSAPAN